MVLINYAGREINAKVVYYGPGLSGKTTNLECIYASVPETSRGKMVSMKTRQDRTLFFDFLPLELGEVHGFRTRFLLYTVPGQVFYNATRKLVLKGADAIVFVADSQRGKMDDNIESLRNLEENLRQNNLGVESMPWILQYNKQDLKDIYSIEELQAALNPRDVPYHRASAATGRGVYETLHTVSKLLFQRLVSELGSNSAPVNRMKQASSHQPVTGLGPQAPAGSSLKAPRSAEGVTPPRVVSPSPQAPPPGTQQTASGSPAGNPTVTSTLEQTPAAPAVVPVKSHLAVQGGNLPGDPTQAEILDTVQAATENLTEEQEQSGDSEFGYVVDLSPEAQAQTPPVSGAGKEEFIRDPMRRAPVVEETQQGGPLSVSDTPGRMIQVPLQLSCKDLVPGTTVRIVLDIKIEP